MEWFGVTCYGVPDPIKDMLRPDYKEPKVQPDLHEILAKGETKKRIAEMLSELDVYLGRVDGYAYKSNHRLSKMKIKNVKKPVGPIDMYKYPGTDGMKYGCWFGDSALEDETWYKTSSKSPLPSTEIGQYLEAALKLDKFFKL